jgi:hypothetical protein
MKVSDNSLVNAGFGDLRISEDLFNRFEGAAERVLAKFLELTIRRIRVEPPKRTIL